MDPNSASVQDNFKSSLDNKIVSLPQRDKMARHITASSILPVLIKPTSNGKGRFDIDALIDKSETS